MNSPAVGQVVQRRNKGFEETHQQMIETAVRLISEKGVEALSVAALARAMGINRTTVYYHFENRDAMLTAVKRWSSDQLAKGLSLAAPRQERMDFITRFVLENPELIKLWIDDFVSPGDIRDRYPFWDLLVEGFDDPPSEGPFDAEVYCVAMLTSAIIGPRVFRNSVRPEMAIAEVVERFRNEHQRVLKRDALL
ncbi:MAG: TetR/AcrR family transcriptional regulator [Bacteroidales bacterium]|nr:TetR/AcrR family transcriptional regulator [Bacteroidales bacterium]